MEPIITNYTSSNIDFIIASSFLTICYICIFIYSLYSLFQTYRLHLSTEKKSISKFMLYMILLYCLGNSLNRVSNNNLPSATLNKCNYHKIIIQHGLHSSLPYLIKSFLLSYRCLFASRVPNRSSRQRQNIKDILDKLL